MRALKLVLVAGISVLCAPVYAADLAPQPVEPMAPVYMPFSWTGFYVGVHAGALLTDSQFDNSSDPNRLLTPTTNFDFDSTSFIGGIHAGYNYQWNQVVVGAEVSADYAGLDDKGFTNGGLTYLKTEQDWLGSAVLKVGYAFDRVLIYGTGGVAITDFENSSHTSAFGLFNRSYGSDSRVGWTLGAGVEYAITDNWIAGLDYKYYDFGSSNYDSGLLGGGGAPAGPGLDLYEIDRTESVITARISYKF